MDAAAYSEKALPRMNEPRSPASRPLSTTTFRTAFTSLGSPPITALPVITSIVREEWSGLAAENRRRQAKGPEFSFEETTQPTTKEDNETIYPKSWKLLAIMVALCLAVFCMALDNTIIATAIPKITDEFHALGDVAWYISAYLLTTCSFQLFFGRLYTSFSVKWVFLVAVSLFEAGSLLCGVAPTTKIFIVGRALAGTGSAGIFSGGILIIAQSVPLQKRPIYIGLAGSMYGIASVAGPLLGGVFTDHLSWRWCFYINLPIGAITVLFIVLCFKDPVQTRSTRVSWRDRLAKLDFPGTAIFIPAIICLILALQWGGLEYDWSDGRVIALLVVFGILTTAFIAIQWWRQENATVPPRIIRQRSVAGSVWYAFTFGGALFILIYYVPIWFQGVWGISATQSGIDSLPLVLGSAMFCVVSGAGITILGYFTPWLILSSVVMTIGCGLVSTFHPSISMGKWVGYQLLAGAGFGLGIQIPVIIVQAVLPADDVATGVAVVMFAQTLGGAVFIAVAQNVFLSKLGLEIEKIIPGISVKSLYQSGGATSLRDFLSGELLDRVLEGYSVALDHAFYAGTALAGLSILGAVFVEWKSVKGQLLLPGA